MTFLIFCILAIPTFVILFIILNYYKLFDEKKSYIIFGIIGLVAGSIIYLLIVITRPNVNDALRIITYAIPIILSLFFIAIREELSDEKDEKIAIMSSVGLIILFVIPMGISMYRTTTTQNFSYIEDDTTIFQSSIDSPIYPFSNEPRDEDVRLITKNFAIRISQQYNSILGSNIQVSSANVIKYNGSLYWCILYKHGNTVTNNRIEGYALIDVNNPNTDPIVNKTENWNYAEGLFFTNDMVRNYYIQNSSYITTYSSRTYPAYDHELNSWVYVCLLTNRD